MYQKILEEAIDELRKSENMTVKIHEKTSSDFVKDCVIETDMEILIPDTYIASSEERYLLYKELNSLLKDEELEGFKKRLADRFGEVPLQVEELIKTIVLRRMSKKAGFEKIILRQGKLIGYFISDPQSDYYQSPQFSHILLTLQRKFSAGRLRQNKEKLTIALDNIQSIEQAIVALQSFMLDVDKKPT
jgi:transcription-repair coupling factor (superfamily II helicase)